MAFLIRSKKIDLIQLARDLDESPDPSMSKIVLRNLIISSKYYKEEEAKELLEVITAESLEKAFASEMVSDELKPKVLLCMLGDKVSNLLVNLGEEELKDYESLKQAVLKEYEPSPPKICLENFRKAKRNSDETFSQFASRLTSMWLYYCKLREANDFESVNQLIVADKMFEMLDSETATHIGVLQGEEWYKPETWANNVIYFMLPKGNPTMNLRELNGMIVKREVLMVVGVNTAIFGEKSDNFSSRKNFDKGQVTEIKNSLVSPAYQINILSGIVRKTKR
ncbi:uncharacterized protein TNCV_5130391 [Trichonephila clavipes]|nr:uncharacterized protein TNCV_5130391 [Trichonephila clavipes]